MKKKSLILYMIAAMTVIGTNGAMAQQSGNEYRIQADKAKNLKINLAEGDIKIVSWARNEISIRVDENLSKADSILSISRDNEELRISPNVESTDLESLKIMVPSKMNIDARTNSGDISILGGISGSITATTLGGDISINEAKGDVELHTNGGDLKTGNIDGNLKLNTLGGDIKVGSVSGSCLLSTNGGDITVANVGKEFECKTFGGDISTGRLEETAKITTLGGTIRAKALMHGAELNTYGGDIYVDEGRGMLQAKNSGGLVRMKRIKGSLNIKSASGDVFAELSPDSAGKSSIKTLNGNIDLYVPDDARASITAAVTGSGSESIRSDFPSVIQSGPKKDDSDFSSGKFEKTCNINGGGQKITLKTMNGSISINKLPRL